MKRYVLTAAVLAALAWRPLSAASEGGDTWSAYGSPVASEKVRLVILLESADE